MAGIFPPRFQTPAKKKVSSVVAEAEVSFYTGGRILFAFVLRCPRALKHEREKCHLSGCKVNGILSLLIWAGSYKGLQA